MDDWHSQQDKLAKELTKRVRWFGSLTPQERWDWLIEHGLIDKDGKPLAKK